MAQRPCFRGLGFFTQKQGLPGVLSIPHRPGLRMPQREWEEDSRRRALGEKPRKIKARRAPSEGLRLLRPRADLAGVLPWKMLMPV